MTASYSPTDVLDHFPSIVEAVREAGFGDDIAWSESAGEPTSADEFAREAIFVICNSGMRFTVARQIYERVLVALALNQSASSAFRHEGKARAIDHIWCNRRKLFTDYLAADDKLAYCAALPWIGKITKYHLAKNFGVDVAKPDVHLARLGQANGCSVDDLCAGLARRHGLRTATVDVVLWRACAVGIVNSREAAPA